MQILDLKNVQRFFSWGVFLLVLVGLDQLVKTYAHNVFKNNFFAFSLPLPVWLMYLVYATVLAGMVYYCVKNYRVFSLLQTLAWTLIFAGAVSNIGERITLGYVRDFIYILNGVFNLADGYIIAGVLMLLLSKNSQASKL